MARRLTTTTRRISGRASAWHTTYSVITTRRFARDTAFTTFARTWAPQTNCRLRHLFFRWLSAEAYRDAYRHIFRRVLRLVACQRVRRQIPMAYRKPARWTRPLFPA